MVWKIHYMLMKSLGYVSFRIMFLIRSELMKNTLWYKNKLYCCGSKSAAVSSSCLLQPETEAEAGAGGEGTSAAAVKRGLSLEAAAAGQDVKRFRTAAGAASTVTYNPPHHHHRILPQKPFRDLRNAAASTCITQDYLFCLLHGAL